jgi:hypothetical protein
LLGGLQASGAIVIHEGSDTRVFSKGEGEFYDVELPAGVMVRVRTSELVNPDGSVGFTPSVLVERGDALERALAIARGDEPWPAAPSGSAATIALQRADESYPHMKFPSREYRLLGLFRVYNVMQYFSPYRHLMDRPWNEVLIEYIPKFEATATPADYGEVVRQFIANLQDTHVGAWSGAAIEEAGNARGTHLPPLVISTIGGRPVVIDVLDESLSASDIAIGDAVVMVDAEDVSARRALLAKGLAASTPQSLMGLVDWQLLRGPPGTQARLDLLRPDGARSQVEVERSMSFEAFGQRRSEKPRRYAAFTTLDAGFGYMDLVQLTPDQVAPAFDAIMTTPALILDIRGYPKGTGWAICARLTAKRSTAALVSREPRAAASRSSVRQRTAPTATSRTQCSLVASG